MRTALCYTRVSTERQAKEGESLTVQIDRLRAYCQAQGWRIARHYEDEGKSGRTTAGRTGLEAAIEHACRTQGVLVAYTLDRISRSTRDALGILDRLRDNGADLVLVNQGLDTSSMFGEFIYTLLAACAQLESRRIGERVRLANEHTVSTRGYRTQGAQPAGYRIERGRRVVVACEQRVVALVNRCRVLRANGRLLWSATTVANGLNRFGVPTINQLRERDSKGWCARSVEKIWGRE